MKLKISDRLIALQVIAPLKGTFDETKKKMKLLDILSIKDKEREDVEMKSENGVWTWKGDKDSGKEVDFVEYKDVCEKAVDNFKALHEEKKDWDETLVAQVEHFEKLINGEEEDGDKFLEEPEEAPNEPKKS